MALMHGMSQNSELEGFSRDQAILVAVSSRHVAVGTGHRPRLIGRTLAQIALPRA